MSAFIKTNFLFFILVYFLFIPKIAALDEKDFIGLVLLKNELFISDEIDLLIKQKRVQSRRQDYYGWHYDLEAKYAIEKLNADKDVRTSYYTKYQLEGKREVAIKASTSFESGASFYVKFGRKLPTNNYDRYNNSGYYRGINLDQQNNELKASLNIPLLKNNDGGSNKLYYDNSILDEKIEELQLLEKKEDLVEVKLLEFINLVTTIKKLNTVKKYISDFKNVLAIVKDRNSTKSDINLVNNKILSILRLLNTQKAELESAKYVLKDYINFFKISIDDIHFGTNNEIKLINNISNYISLHNRDLLISKLDLKKKKTYVKRYENQKLADLDLNINSTSTRDKGNYSSYSYYNKNDFVVSLDFSYPLNGSATNDYNLLKASLEYRKKLLDYEDEINKKHTKIKLAIDKIKSLIKNLESYENQIRLTDINTELKKYLAGNGDIKFVISEIDDFYELKLKYLSEELLYHSERIKYKSLIDNLLPKNNALLKCNFCLHNQ